MRSFSKMLALAAFAVSGPAAAEGIDELVVMCESCHGPAGVSQHADVPTIAGQTDAFLVKALRTYQVWGRPCIKSAYRYGDTGRPKTDMCAISEGLSSEDIQALAGHFAAQAFVPAKQPFDPELAAAGEALHEAQCESCHQDGGSTAGRGPRLAGQWTTYLKTSLRFVPTGEHLVPPAMEKTVNDLGADEIEALMNYYASQQD